MIDLPIYFVQLKFHITIILISILSSKVPLLFSTKPVVPPNGLRYPLVGGTRQHHFNGTNSKPHKLPENARTPTSRVHPIRMVAHPFSRKKPSSAIAMAKYTPNRQVWRPYKAMETRKVVVPRCTVVAGQIDVSTGGEGATPMRKLNP